MSVASLSSLAAKRNNAASSISDNDKPAPTSIPSYLLAMLPTELIAPYSLLLAFLLTQITPSETVPDPDRRVLVRFVVVIALTIAVAVWTWLATKAKSADAKFFSLEVGGAAVACLGWGLSTPGNPLGDAFGDDLFWASFGPLAVGAAALAIAILIAKFLTIPKAKS